MDALKQALAQIDPDTELRFFSQGENQSQYKAYLTITNVSQGNIAYKVKTTSPKFYVVKPNQGIIDKGDKITIDITMIPSSENKVEDNKFLVQIAACELQSSETYQLQTFWDKLPKNLSLSYKLKVSIAKTAGTTSPTVQRGQADLDIASKQQQPQQQPTSRFPADNDRRTSQMEQNVSQIITPQDNLQRSSIILGTGGVRKHEYEKAPDDQINESLSQSLSQSQVVNQDQIKRKTEEAKQQLDQVLLQKQKLQQEISKLKNQHIEDEKVGYEWQQPDSKNEFKFQLIHLLITAIICLFIGGYLGARDTSAVQSGAMNNDTIINATIGTEM